MSFGGTRRRVPLETVATTPCPTPSVHTSLRTQGVTTSRTSEEPSETRPDDSVCTEVVDGIS